MTAIIESNPSHPRARAVRTVDVAGAAWPAHKLQAVAMALVVGVIGLAVLGPQIAAWLAAGALSVTWVLARHLPGNTVPAPR
ncbi:hypothetical protein ACLQ3C_14435 [Gordonia sp. DT30]|uniref:hypothetical protein n=1 Tax=unclassified Gordonia (in: high G+C Gram-positive bacteria) TaxID=2657482 RepID=UPI003CF8F9AD